MLEFAYQVKSCAVHSIGAIRGVQSGNFSPDQTMPPDSFEGLAARMAETIDALRALEIADVEGLSERRSEEHTSELQSLMRISYAVFFLNKKITTHPISEQHQ